jgi:hypothetical protein
VVTACVEAPLRRSLVFCYEDVFPSKVGGITPSSAMCNPSGVRQGKLAPSGMSGLTDLATSTVATQELPRQSRRVPSYPNTVWPSTASTNRVRLNVMRRAGSRVVALGPPSKAGCQKTRAGYGSARG